jgi:hypothetical protein
MEMFVTFLKRPDIPGLQLPTTQSLFTTYTELYTKAHQRIGARSLRSNVGDRTAIRATAAKKCASHSCGLLPHSDAKVGGGTHCCGGCRKSPGAHDEHECEQKPCPAPIPRDSGPEPCFWTVEEELNMRVQEFIDNQFFDEAMMCPKVRSPCFRER